MFKDSFNCLNDVHKRCILNSIEFCTHLEILKRIFKVVFLFSYQSSSLSNPVFICVWEAFVSLSYRGDLIIISPPITYVNNFFQFFFIFLICFFNRRKVQVCGFLWFVCLSSSQILSHLLVKFLINWFHPRFCG